MNTPNATVDIRHVIARTTAELLAAVNASNADRCSAVWADDGVLMPPHHPSVQGHEAIVNYFRGLFSRSKFRFAFTSSNIDLAGDIALERVTYTAIIWPAFGSRMCLCDAMVDGRPLPRTRASYRESNVQPCEVAQHGAAPDVGTSDA